MRFRLLERGLRRVVGLVMGTAVTAVVLASVPLHREAFADDPGRETPATVAAPGFTPAEARLKADVTFLAADAREGRAPGTGGIEDAARYIAATFKQYGLKPAPGADGYFQKFPLKGRPSLGKPTQLAVLKRDDKVLTAEPKTEFSPLAIGSGGSIEQVPIVFAGYGITAKDSALQLDYDDYADVDVQGKAVLIIRREPQQEREDSPFAGKRTSDYATFRHKATNAFQHGAAIVLLVNDLAGLRGDPDRVLGLGSGGPDMISNLPFVDACPRVCRQDSRGRGRTEPG